MLASTVSLFSISVVPHFGLIYNPRARLSPSAGMSLCGTRGPPLALRPGLQDLLGPGVGRAAAERGHVGQLHLEPHVFLGRGDDVDGGVPDADVRRPGDPARTVLPFLPDEEGTGNPKNGSVVLSTKN